MLSVLSCLIAVELQWSFESLTVLCIIQASCKLTSIFLFSLRKIFWLFIMLFICKEALFLQNSVACFVCLLWARFKTEFSSQTKIWNELQQWERSDNSVLFNEAFFWWLCMLLQFDMSCCFSSFSLVSERQLNPDKDSEEECTSQFSTWLAEWSCRHW